MKSYMQIFRPTAILISVCVVSLRAHPGPVCGKDLSVGAGVASSGLCLAAPDDLQGQARSSKLKIAVAQTVIENTLEKNLAKMVRMIDDAGARGCRLAIFPENALYWADVSTDGATKEDIDAAIEKIAERAGRADLCVVFGTSHKPSDGAKYRNRGYVFGSDGDMLVSCWKTKDVPNAFEACGVVCNLVICSDRTFLEYSDLPCLVQGSQIIIDISGGHGGDDGRPDMRWIRYRPCLRHCQQSRARRYRLHGQLALGRMQRDCQARRIASGPAPAREGRADRAGDRDGYGDQSRGESQEERSFV